MLGLKDVSKFILERIDHNRGCGKDDEFILEEIASIIEKRLLGKERKAIIKPVFMYSREPFEGWTNRYLIQMEIENGKRDTLNITIYSNDNSYFKVVEYLRARASDKVLGFNLLYRATISQDEAASRLLDEVLSKLPIIGSSY